MIVTVSAAAVNQSAVQSIKQPSQTAKDAIAANIAALAEQLQQGHSEALTAYLTAMGRFREYSFGNIIEIARQRPTATRVAGFHTWKQFGRNVKKGERGIRIFAPIIGARRRVEEDAESDRRPRKESQVVGFRAVYVFDVSQTEGKELPELAERVTGSVGEYRDRLFTFIAGQNIEIEFNDTIAPALGASYGGRIALLPGQAAPEEFLTLVHELAHEMLHRTSRRTETTKTVRELEAESIAFVVAQAIGLNTGHSSANYIRLYNGDAALLAERLEVIQQTSAAILSALEMPAKSNQTELSYS